MSDKTKKKKKKKKKKDSIGFEHHNCKTRNQICLIVLDAILYTTQIDRNASRIYSLIPYLSKNI